MTRTAHRQQPNLAGIYPAVLDVDVRQSLRPVELHQSRVDALVQKLDALAEQPQLLFIQSANNPVATDQHHHVQPSPYTSIIIPHRAIQRPFLLCTSTLLIFTHHPPQGKSTGLFYTVLILYSPFLTGQISQPFLLFPYPAQPLQSVTACHRPTAVINVCITSVFDFKVFHLAVNTAICWQLSL